MLEMKFLLYFCLFIFLGTTLTAQSQKQQSDLLKKGKDLVHAGDFEQANMTFRRILTLDHPIPSEFCYYFSKTLYHIGQYRNSRSFIDKYYEIAGQGGDYYKDIQHLEGLVDAELTKITECDFCDHNGYRLVECEHCSGSGETMKVCSTCKGKGNTLCDLCGGEGVLIRRNLFNTAEYQTCNKCEGTGITKCPTCEGKKEVTTICSVCRGVGGVSSGHICDHMPDAHEHEHVE
jgi:hypothetical protein